MEMPFSPQPKPKKKEKKPYKGIQSKKPLKRSPLKPKPVSRKPKIPKPVKRSKPKTKNELKMIRSGDKIPDPKKRNEFSDKERKKAYDAFGHVCAQCGSPYIELHHAKFRSGSGRGVWRNGIPLCNLHHSMNHNGAGSRAYAEKWRKLLESMYGEYYYWDEWDLWLKGLIADPDKKLLEEFMEEEERKIRENG